MGGGGFMYDFYNRVKDNLSRLGNRSFLGGNSDTFKFKKFTLYKSEKQMLKSEQKDLEHLRKRLSKKDNYHFQRFIIILLVFICCIALGVIFS